MRLGPKRCLSCSLFDGREQGKEFRYKNQLASSRALMYVRIAAGLLCALQIRAVGSPFSTPRLPPYICII
jgi:hypothetical protein